VTKVTPAKTVSLDEARPQIEQEVKTEAAANQAYQGVQKYQAAHDKGSTLVEAAKAAGATPITVGPVTSGGANADGQPQPGLSPRILKEAFALPQGGVTDVIQDSKGEYFAARVDKVIPPALPTLDKVRPKLMQAFLQREMGKRLEAKLNDLAGRVRKGETLGAVAASIGSQINHLSITRSEAQQSRSLPPALVQQIFSAKVGDVIVTGSGVARVDSIVPPAPGIIAATLPSGQLTLARAIIDEIQQESRDWARAEVKPKINVALARQAIGASATGGAGALGGQTGMVAPAAPAR
jgi:peptidyl-prolyl cis-trans isomerase D